MNLNKIFNPKSIAIIGASNKKGSVGCALYANAISSKLKRSVYPVNIKGKMILGVKSYVNVADIKKKIDLAVIATPAATVPNVVLDCAKAKIRGVIIISAGFNESGRDGKKLFDRIGQIAKDKGIRIMGPNCLGFINPHIDLNMSFASKQALPGKVAFVSQSGAMCTAVLDWASQKKIGFSNFVSIGSALDIGFSDMLEYLSKDKKTKYIVLYMESLNNPVHFIDVCKKITKNKMIFVLKSGRSKAGANAAKSHTGSLAGNDKAYDALFRQAGIIRINTIQDVYDSILLSSSLENKISKPLAIITNAGGPGVITTDSLLSEGGILAKLTKNTITKLNAKLSSSWSGANPIDIIGDADPKRFKDVVQICFQDKNIDSLLVVLTPQAMTNPVRVAKDLSSIKTPKNKFLFAVFIGGEDVAQARDVLLKNNIAVFDTPEKAIKSFVRASNWWEKKSIKKLQQLDEINIKIKKERANQILNKAMLEQKKQLSEAEAKKLLACYKIPVLSFAIVGSKKSAGEESSRLGYPVAMKISSSDILHKIDCGGVALDVGSQQEAQKIYSKIIRSAKKYHPKANIEGVYIEPMQKTDLELIIGLSYDQSLGLTLMFGRGGTEVELYQDVSFGVLPLSRAEILDLVKQTKVYSLLRGYRGKTGVEVKKLLDLIYKVSLLAQDFDIIKELDINPLSIYKGKMTVLDAKIVLK